MTLLSSQIEQQRERHSNGYGWLDIEIEFIRQKAKEGETAGVIAAALKRSRNSVLGKMHREGIKINRVIPAVRDVKTTANTPPRARPLTARRKYDATALRIELYDLKKDQCRWPVTDDKPFLFCGHKAKDGKSYCPHHQERSRRLG